MSAVAARHRSWHCMQRVWPCAREATEKQFYCSKKSSATCARCTRMRVGDAPHYREKLELPWSDQIWEARREHALFLRSQGYLWKQIAAALGVSRERAAQMARKQELKNAHSGRS